MDAATLGKVLQIKNRDLVAAQMAVEAQSPWIAVAGVRMGATSVVRYSNHRGSYRIDVVMATSFEAFELMCQFIYPGRKPHLG